MLGFSERHHCRGRIPIKQLDRFSAIEMLVNSQKCAPYDVLFPFYWASIVSASWLLALLTAWRS
jgi:hypothetical protein